MEHENFGIEKTEKPSLKKQELNKYQNFMTK